MTATRKFTIKVSINDSEAVTYVRYETSREALQPWLKRQMLRLAQQHGNAKVTHEIA